MTLKITHLPFFKSCVMNKLSISYRDGHKNMTAVCIFVTSLKRKKSVFHLRFTLRWCNIQKRLWKCYLSYSKKMSLVTGIII